MSSSVRTALGLCTVAVVLLACMSDSTPAPVSVPTDIPVSTAVPVPTWTATSTSTSTPEPTITPTFTPAPSSTPLLPVGTGGAVCAVLFYSPTCPHCHYVMEEVLPPLQDEFGDQLVIAAIDVSTPEGSDTYYAAVAYFAIPSERLGVPTMIVGDTVLVGSGEIPAFLPDLIKQGLDQGGVGWPEIPGFEPSGG